jgi:hypothetical protein
LVNDGVEGIETGAILDDHAYRRTGGEVTWMDGCTFDGMRGSDHFHHGYEEIVTDDAVIWTDCLHDALTNNGQIDLNYYDCENMNYSDYDAWKCYGRDETGHFPKTMKKLTAISSCACVFYSSFCYAFSFYFLFYFSSDGKE